MPAFPKPGARFSVFEQIKWTENYWWLCLKGKYLVLALSQLSLSRSAHTNYEQSIQISNFYNEIFVEMSWLFTNLGLPDT